MCFWFVVDGPEAHNDVSLTAYNSWTLRAQNHCSDITMLQLRMKEALENIF